MDVEQRATIKVSDLITKCASLKPFIDANDRTPFTDGFVDIHSSPTTQSKSTTIGRVSVQVKGRTKKHTKNPKHRFHIDDLRGYRVNLGIVFFLVLMDKQGQNRRVYYAILNPFRIDAIIDSLQPNQTKASVALKEFPSNAKRIESIFRLANMKRSEHSALKLPIESLTEIQSMHLYTSDNIDFSVPQTINSEEHDFLVRIESELGNSIPDISKLRIVPETYREAATDIIVSAGGIEFANPIRRRTSQNRVELRLNPGLSLIRISNEDAVTNQISLTEPTSIAGQKKNLDFFLHCLKEQKLSIDGTVFPFELLDHSSSLAELEILHDTVSKIAQVLSTLHCNLDLVSPADIDPKRARQLLDLHEILHGDASLNDHFKQEGRILQPLGRWSIELLALQNSESGELECFSLFDPKLKRSFAMGNDLPDGNEIATLVTPYELVNEDHLDSVLNLNLERAIDFYDDLIAIPEVFQYANQFVLKLLLAADRSDMRRQEFLDAANSINQWLLSNDAPNFHHRINHWQIEKRRNNLLAQARTEIRSLKSRIQHAENYSLAKHAEISCSILLEDWEQVGFELTQLSSEEYSTLTYWPIWNLYPISFRRETVVSD